MNPETKKLLETIHTSPYGKALSEYLDLEIKKLDTVKGLTTLEEAIGRKLAVETLESILYFIRKPNPQAATKKVNYT